MLRTKVTTTECARMLAAKERQIEVLTQRVLERNEEIARLRASLAQLHARAEKAEHQLQSYRDLQR